MKFYTGGCLYLQALKKSIIHPFIHLFIHSFIPFLLLLSTVPFRGRHSGSTTSVSPRPLPPYFDIHHLHILLHYIHGSFRVSSSFSLAWLLHLQWSQCLQTISTSQFSASSFLPPPARSTISINFTS